MSTDNDTLKDALLEALAARIAKGRQSQKTLNTEIRYDGIKDMAEAMRIVQQLAASADGPVFSQNVHSGADWV